MPFTLLSSLFISFLLVRVIKGPWMRYPHYLGLAMLGSLGATIALGQYSPGLEEEFLAGNAACFAGAFAAIKVFDTATGT